MRRDSLTYVIAILASLFVHLGLWGGLTSAAHMNPRERRAAIQFAVVQKPPPPKPTPAEPEKPKKKPPPPPVDTPVLKTPIPELPPPPNTSMSDAPAEKAKPVFGISMSSVVGPGSGSGFAVRVGNTLMKAPEEAYTPPTEVKAYKPVPLHAVNKMPTPKGGVCRGDKREYPAQAKELGIEGRVQLLIEVRADGTVGDATVVAGLGYGLDEAAIRTVKKCLWNPAFIGDEAVTTKLNFGVTFIIED